MRRALSLLAGAVALLFAGSARAQLVVDGVVHDSQTLAPLSDVVLLVLDDQTGQPLSPGFFSDPAQQGQITGPDGRYRIQVQGGLQIRLTFERPDARFVFPSLLAPPAGVACTLVSCDGGVVDPSPSPRQGGIYAIRFVTDGGREAKNNHVPVDPLGALVRFTFSADRDRAGRGEYVVYTARVENTSRDPLPDLELSVVLPSALRFLAESVVAPAAPRQSDLQLRFPVPLPQGGTATVRFAAKVAAASREPRLRTEAAIERGGGIVLSTASAELTLSGDPNLDLSTILGRVFCDRPPADRDGGRPGWQDAGEPGLYAARIYLDTGFWVETDMDGLFTFTGVPSGVRYLKLDEGSLPPKSAPRSPIRSELYLSPGMPGKVSFAVDCRLETWSAPTRIEPVKSATVARLPPPAMRTVRLAFDAETRRIEIGDRVDRFLEARISGELRADGIRFFLGAIGPANPSRWTIRLAEIDAAGEETRQIRDEALTGRGHPPLFIDFAPEPPAAGHAFRARLELEAEEGDRSLSPPVDLIPGSGGAGGSGAREEARMVGRAEEASLEAGLAAVPVEGERRLSIEAHWDAAEGEAQAVAKALALGQRAKEILIRRGVPAARIEVRSRGAEAPLFPSLVARLRNKNRRVEIFLSASPPRIAPPRAPASARRLALSVDQKQANLPLVDRAQVELTVDLDVPAKVELTFHDGAGGEHRMQRVVAHDWVSRSGQRMSIAPALDPERRVLDLGPVEIALPQEPLHVDAIQLVSTGIEVGLGGRDGIVRWRIEVREPKSGRTLATRAEEGEPPALVALVLSATVASELVVAAEYPERVRWEPVTVLLPPWSPVPKEVTISGGPALKDPKSALSDLIADELDSPPAKIAIRIDGGTETQRAELLEKLGDLPLIEDPVQRLDGELTVTARLVFEENVALPAPRERGDVLPYGMEPIAGDLDMEVSGRVLALEEPGGLLVVPLSDLEPLPRAEPPKPKSKSPSAEGEDGITIEPELLTAAQVELIMPALGETLSRASLPVVGLTDPENQIRINGDEVAVQSDGRFAYTLDLEPGANRVRIESTDPDGNLAIFERKVESSSVAWFLMAMGEGSAAGGGAHLAGSNDDTRAELGPFSLDGRVLAYGKARFAFSGPIEQLEITGRFDSAEQADSTLLRLSDDPLRLLPAFGDASLEVQDAASRHKGYLDVVADRSRITLGNASTKLSPFGEDSFFSFRRAGFGVHADLVQSFADWDETRIAGTYGFENEGLRRGHDEIQGTGGTMYWLANDELVEGSARARLVVRDRDTGMVLSTTELVEGQQFELRPREGRIMFRQPVPSVAGLASFGLNRSVALNGHPIYVVIDYEYLASGADEKSWGVEARETLFNQLELYFGAAGEDRTDGDHRVFAGAIAWRPAAGSYLELEYARSDGATGLGAISVDGGFNFRPLNGVSDDELATLREGGTPFFNAYDPEAISLAGHLDLADLSDDADGPRGFVHAYGRKAGLSFSSLSVGREQGRLAGGIAAAYGITKEVTARASVDGAYAIQPADAIAGSSVPGLFRLLSVLGADYRDEQNAVTLEGAFLRSVTTGLDPLSSGGISVRYEREINRELSLGIAQDALFGSDALTGGGLGRLATTAFGFWRLTDELQLSLAETVRWNGENATQLGLRVETDEGLVAYVAERFSESGSEPRLTTIIGAEDQVAEGSRTYGEMQLDGGANPGRMLAVLGMDNRWRVAEGLDLLLSYERAQLTAGDAPTLSNDSPFVAPFGGVSATLGGFGQDVGLLPGAVSRDAIAGGISWVASKRLKLSQRIEFRIDDATAATGSDYLIIGSHTGFGLQLHRDLTTLGRLTIQHARDTTNDRTFARAIEGSISAVYRPRVEDWFTMVLRYTKLILQRPEALDPDRRVTDRDAFSAEPIVDTPWNLQLVERVAFVRNRETAAGLPPLEGWLLLWVNRLNARFFDVIEAGVEYRMLLDLEIDTAERGFLIEAGYLPVEYVRIGAGYNFTRFSDDVLALADRDASGPFLRVTARY